MRISLLQQREPFASIFERTFSRFLAERCGVPVAVRWHAQPGFRARAGQAWFANIYLNAIFPARAGAAAFEPLRREFSRSRSGWQRPFQRAYVWAASAPFASRLLAQAWLEITPSVPETGSWLVVPGNNKIRVLDRLSGLSISILKDGFDPGFFHSELEARRSAAAAGVMVPALRRVSASGGWFEEQYVLGTPLNRLPDAADADLALRRVAASLQPFYQASLAQRPLAGYLEELASGADDRIERSHLLDAAHRRSLRALVAACLRRLEPFGAEPVDLCLCHGDFQPANLLADGPRTWLVDWEYARRCQAGYDALVYGLGARRPRGLAARLRGFASGQAPLPPGLEAPGLQSSGSSTASGRARAACIFLLEEIALHLRENANPQFYRLGEGLLTLEQEISEYLSMEEYPLG
jgi:hypothetical protein